MDFVNNIERAKGGSFSSVLPMLLFLCLLFFLNFTSRVILSPLLPEIEKGLNVSHAAAASIFFYLTLGYFLSILCSGYVSSRISHKYTIVLSTLVTGVLVFALAFVNSINGLRLVVFLLGSAAGVYLPSGLSTIVAITPASHLGRGMAVHEFAPNIGFVAAPVLCTIMILAAGSWQDGIAFMGGAVVLSGMLFAVFGYQAGRQASCLTLSVINNVLKKQQFLMIVLLFGFAICSTLGIYSLLPLFLVNDLHMDPTEANRLVSFSRILSVFMPLCASWVGDRLGHRLVMICSLFLSGMLTIPFGICNGWLLTLFVTLQPMVAVCFFPSVFAYLANICDRKDTGLIVSVAVPLAFLTGGGVLPLFMGYIGDVSNLGMSFIIVGILMIAASCVALKTMRDSDER